MTSTSHDSERVVFLALRGTCNMRSYDLRDPEKFRALVEKHKKRSSVGSVIKDYGLEEFHEIASHLYEREIFTSRARAKARFPELFGKHAKRLRAANDDSKQEPSHNCTNEIVITEDQQLDGVNDVNFSQGQQVSIQATETTITMLSNDQLVIEDDQTNASFKFVAAINPNQFTDPSPFSASSKVACYKFGEKHFKNINEVKGWNCPEAVELSEWSKMFQDKFLKAEASTAELRVKYGDSFKSVIQLRNVAVHRRPVNTAQISEFLHNAETLVWLLQDEKAFQEISSMSKLISRSIDEIVQIKISLADELVKNLEPIKELRAELDEIEKVEAQNILEREKERLDSVNDRISNILSTLGMNKQIV